MQPVPADERARLQRQRIRRAALVAKLEYNCRVLRRKLARVVAEMKKRGPDADEGLTREIEHWSTVVSALEERTAREAAALGAFNANAQEKRSAASRATTETRRRRAPRVHAGSPPRADQDEDSFGASSGHGIDLPWPHLSPPARRAP
jgi:hypothetical protein